jgi:hypothetical protein
MKTFSRAAFAALVLSTLPVHAESPVEKVEQGVTTAVTTTEQAVTKAAKKTGQAVETAAVKTGDAVQGAAKTTEKTAKKAARKTKKATEDVANSEMFQKIEKAAGKPFTPEQKQKYAEAWAAAQEKARATEKEFADKVSEITGLGKRKSKQIVNEHGL